MNIKRATVALLLAGSVVIGAAPAQADDEPECLTIGTVPGCLSKGAHDYILALEASGRETRVALAQVRVERDALSDEVTRLRNDLQAAEDVIDRQATRILILRAKVRQLWRVIDRITP